MTNISSENIQKHYIEKRPFYIEVKSINNKLQTIHISSTHGSAIFTIYTKEQLIDLQSIINETIKTLEENNDDNN